MSVEEIWRRRDDTQEAGPVVAEGRQTGVRSHRPFESEMVWLVERVVLAIGLMMGFYVFALVIALGLLWIPYAEWTYVHRVDIKIAAVCIGAALTILWALVPRPDVFHAPGPRLDESRHPKLFEMIRQVACATGQAAPTDVYLLNDVNAWVTHRGGTMGFGSHRVMGVGLPLLQALSVSQLRAIIAHEFGHYASSDVTLGPWIYKTRAAIGRAIAGVHDTFIEAPFLWYGKQFLKLTHAVSRRQEFVADQVAVRVAGAPAFAYALRRTASLSPAFSAYVSNEVMPILRAGCLPPIAAGFAAFLKVDAIADASQRLIAEAEADGQTDPFDTHPSLRDRLAALGPEQNVSGTAEGNDNASVLIGDPDKLARALVEFALGHDTFRRLKPIEWTAVGDAVFAPRWREVVQNYSPWLSRFTVDRLPIGKHAFIRLGSELLHPGEQNVNGDERIGRAVHVLAVAVGVLLLEDGWRAVTAPGRPVVLVRESATYDPFIAVRALSEGVITAAAWKAQCDELGIATRPLAIAETPREASRTADTMAWARPHEPTKRSEVHQVACYRCKHMLSVSFETRGKAVKCPQCGTKQSLPL